MTAKKKKNAHAVALGAAGGKARAKALGPDACSKAARLAVTARWDAERAKTAALLLKVEKRKRGRAGSKSIV
jgi:hypothetical protein